ncbi:MAG: hypothetical protein LAKADJCE_00234 [Candidatus Argoarchaeum ethanivorans]|uniref:Uncharacterized protein n=1 Tax=Candidatus Argoarchaeum ethanivorans TaxID=2608793 RepID=A0A811TC05_9EURY|nr:MAG: hypothetical protein LAKADJCE_00234 [Candidatus Argoarchaeum ethanivorans]
MLLLYLERVGRQNQVQMLHSTAHHFLCPVLVGAGLSMLFFYLERVGRQNQVYLLSSTAHQSLCTVLVESSLSMLLLCQVNLQNHCVVAPPPIDVPQHHCLRFSCESQPDRPFLTPDRLYAPAHTKNHRSSI